MSRKHRDRLLTFVYLSIILIGGIKTYFSDTVKTSSLPINQKSIILDAGHGGYDPGKVYEGIEEKAINLDITQRLTEYLNQAGCYVIPSRTEDTALDKNKRIDLKKRAKLSEDGDLFISIHQNYFPKASVKGAQVFFHKNSEEGKRLAECIQKRLISLDSENTRVPKANSEYYLLKNSKAPAVIIECGFLSNPDERNRLTTEEYRSALAWAIYLGISDYYSDTDV